jgi:hypothetical protein
LKAIKAGYMGNRICLALLIVLAEFHAPFAKGGELHEAVKAGDMSAVARLVAAGVKVDDPNYFGTALDIAVARGFTPIAEMLIKAGANIEAPTSANTGRERPLHLAASSPERSVAAR